MAGGRGVQDDDGGAGGDDMSKARREIVPVRECRIKLHNRRIKGGLMQDGTILFTFRYLTPDGTVEGQRIRLSIEGLAAMVMIAERLTGAEA